MKKSLKIALLLTVSFPALLIAAEESLPAEENNASGTYELNADAAESYKLKENVKTAESTAASTEAADQTAATPKIVREDIAGGYVERLLDETGKVVAEKKIIDNEVVEKVLNYYYPDGNLMRRISTNGEYGFIAEEYYTNGKIAAQSNYINESSKIGKERKYDINGVLRQEIPWVLPEEEKQKTPSEQLTKRQGNVITYFPNGRVAAIFPVNVEGKNSFYNQQGKLIKEIDGVEILSFAPEMTAADCQSRVVKLTLEDLVALYEDEGDVSYNKCGLPYRENFVYEITDTKGQNATKISYDETGMIRRITPYKGGLKNGVTQKFDASGNITAEINYKDGEKNGMASGYFPTRMPAFRKRYENGKVVGALTCYFPNGEKAAEIFYKDGKKDGTAKIYGANAREIEFINGEIADSSASKKAPRTIAPSVLSAATEIEPKCLNIKDKLSNIDLEIAAGEKTITETFTLDIPEKCEDMSTFKAENSVWACYVGKTLRAVYPVDYKRGAYAVEKIYDENGKKSSEIAYVKQKRQGVSKKYNTAGKLEAELYYDQGNLVESSRSYHSNGAIKEIMTIADGAPRKMLARYADNGQLMFSVNYNNGDKEDAFIADAENKQDIYIKYYEGKPDSLRETNIDNSGNYTDYNLVLGEYAVYENNELVKGGYLCGYDKQTTIKNSPLAKAAPTPVKEEAVPAVAAKSAVEETVAAPTITVQEEQVKPAPVQVPEAAPVAVEQEPEVTPSVEELVIPAGVNPLEYLKRFTAAPVKKKAPEETAKSTSVQPQPVIKNAIIPTEEEKRQAELAALNIGPTAKPDIEELTDVVDKQHVRAETKAAVSDLSKTEKIYYPNGNLRKTIKTKGGRTEEIKEYSKTGLLLNDTIYKDDGILIEKYSGTGEIRRKVRKDYTDNIIMAFVSREDFYDNGQPRYMVSRKPDVLLFTEKQFYSDGNVKSENNQESAFKFTLKEYTPEGRVVKTSEQDGLNTLVTEYDDKGGVSKLTFNGKDMPVSLTANSTSLFADNAKIYDKNGGVKSEMTAEKNAVKFSEYTTAGKLKSEVVFYDNGEIDVKGYDKAGELVKFAYLAPDGKLNIQKPAVRVIPAYRERYWVEYNNPRWVENQDKYSIYSIARLDLDTAAYILAELEMDVPDMLKKLYEKY